MEPIPVLLFGREFWRKIINWEALADAGTISPEDLDLFHFVETAHEGWEIVREAEGIGKEISDGIGG
jgi:predicted Rossmann-fold nucleotide-binding protein